MKPGTRALGIAESYTSDVSTIAGVVVRADRVVDGAAFTTCTVGGADLTDRIIGLYDSLDRDDIQYVFIAGIALAWFNIIDLDTIHTRTAKPAISVTFEASPGLEPAITREFAGSTRTTKLQQYRSQPPRDRIVVNDEPVFVRAVGISPESIGAVVRAFTPTGGRPEPLRVARLLARAGDAWQAD